MRFAGVCPMTDDVNELAALYDICFRSFPTRHEA